MMGSNVKNVSIFYKIFPAYLFFIRQYGTIAGKRLPGKRRIRMDYRVLLVEDDRVIAGSLKTS